MPDEPVRGVVRFVSKQKRYALCVLQKPQPESGSDDTEETMITFNLSSWTGEGDPRKGQIALLRGVEKYERGWRAKQASPETLP